MIGKPLSRIDGPLKVTGRAIYAYDHQEVGRPFYGMITCATIAKGRIAAIDTSRVDSVPGVKLVLTHENLPRRSGPDRALPWKQLGDFPELVDSEIKTYGQPVALVVAETFEEAREASYLIKVTYHEQPGHYDLESRLDQAYAPKMVNADLATDTAIGDFESGFQGAPVKIDACYTTPYLFSQPLEPHACLAAWQGEDLTVYMGIQMVADARSVIAGALGIDERRVHVEAPFVGGGFGSKLRVHAETFLAALAAGALGHPVKVAMLRQQMFHLIGHRPASVQRVRLGAEPDGKLIALAHEVTMANNPYHEYAEQTATSTRSMYAAPHRLTRHRLVNLDLPPGDDVRAPGQAPGLLAVESAMDELAHTLGVDPLELRVRNEPKTDPETGQPFSERRLLECMREGARRFGWERRPTRPASRRDGRWLVGYGMAVGVRKHFQADAKVSVRVGTDGIAVVRTDLPDIGTGHYTVMTQIAAEALGLPIERVCVELGRSDFPTSSGSGGSWGAPSTGVALHLACTGLRDKLFDAARNDAKSALRNVTTSQMKLDGGRVRAGDKSEALVDLIARNHPQGVEAEGAAKGMANDPNFEKYSQHTYGAHFVELGVDADTGEVRLRRMLGVFSAGRILNPKTARSQMIGGMIWGVSAALHEEGVVDTRLGAYVNRDLAGYLIPVSADIPELDAVLLEGFDDKANILGIKGMGEVAICGAGAAVANAVFNATGVRVRDFPITIEKLLLGLPRFEH